MTGKRSKPEDLREACIREAVAIIDTAGLEGLSLREVARRLGVSHQAPYKHFQSRDHILAEIVERAFSAFARHLDARPRSPDPDQDLGAMGVAYLEYAHSHPLQYRLMFGTPLPDADAHPAMMREARHAFSLLTDGLRRVMERHGRDVPDDALARDALFIWSALHGLAMIRESDTVRTLPLPAGLIEGMPGHVLERIGGALAAAAASAAGAQR